MGDDSSRNENELEAAVIRSLIDAPLWNLDSVTFVGDDLEIEGWVVHDEISSPRGIFEVNNIPFDVTENSLQRDDLGRLFWHTKGSEKGGFRCKLKGATNKLANCQCLDFSYVNTESKIPYKESQNIYFHRDQSQALPPAAYRARVHGSEHEASFLLEGSSNFEKTRRALLKYAGKDYREFNRILDWGCGCGRLTRHFSGIADSCSITGVDIDAESIDWCSRHLGFGKFTSISPNPPASFENDSFDLIIGISIFTHLREEDQFAWLEELHRIADKGAILAVTTNGTTTIYRSGSFQLLRDLTANEGYLDLGASFDISDVIEDQSYYRNTYHMHKYIRSRWSSYFEIVEIVPGCIGNSQDLVILRKK